MNTLDIIFCIILGTLCLRGTYRGMVREIASIFGLILAFFLANAFHDQLLPYVQQWIETPGYAKAATYLTIFFGTMIAVFLLSTLLKNFLKLIMLGWLDRLGGGAFGLAKGLLLCSVILLVLTAFLSPKASILSESKVAPYIGTINEAVVDFLPQDMEQEFRSKSKSLKEIWHSDWLDTLHETKDALRDTL